MEIKKYIDILMKRLWLIITLPVVVGLIAVYVNVYVFVPIYKASTTLLITGLSTSTAETDMTATMSFEDIIAGQSLISEYSAIISSKRVTGAVVKELNDPDITEDDIRNMIGIGAVDDTRIIEISIVHEKPAEAAKIADIVAKVFSDEIVALYKIENVDIIDQAEVPEFPVEPEKTKNVILSVFAAFVFAVGIILLIEFLNTKIKTSEDVETRLGLNVIGSIPVNSLNKGRNK
jgi:capsular polysaccharide biosynthesis protein